MYVLRIRRHARKSLEKLRASRDDLIPILDAIDSLKSGPFRNAEKLQSGTANGFPVFRRRVGNYRIIYSVNRREIIVEIIAVGNRRDIYRMLKRLL